MKFRRFSPDDAEFCFQLRKRAFTDLFRNQLQPEEVTAAVNTYQPADYIRMDGQGSLFIAEKRGRRAGFFYLKRTDPAVAELCLIYIDPIFHRQGIGSRSIDFIGRWISSNWKSVRTLIVDTVIAGYNAGFYQKAGFVPLKQTVCRLSGKSIKALRLTMQIKPSA